MRITFASIFFISLFLSCLKNNSNSKESSNYGKSFKEQEDHRFDEHLDSITKIYSNFKYHIAFDAPNNWKTDRGVSEHTIFRSFQPDSSLTFSINVIEMKLAESDSKDFDIWELYQNNKDKMDSPYKNQIEEQLKTTINDFHSQNSYIKNHSCLMRKFNYNLKDLDYEVNITFISYQTFMEDFSYTFSFAIPTMFYDENPKYYDDFFTNIYFLKKGERINQ